MNKRGFSYIIFLFMVILLIAGCNNQKTDKIPQSQNKAVVYLYFADEQAMFLHPEARTIQYPTEGYIAQIILEELIKGPYQEGFYKTIPEESKVNSVKIENGTAIVDFNKDFQDKSPGGSTGENMQIGSIVQTLTELPEIELVQILIEGKRVQTLVGHLILDEPMARSIQTGSPYINTSYIERQQELVMADKNKWRLDPLETAKNEGSQLGLYANGSYYLIESNGNEAKVKHEYKNEVYTITLIKVNQEDPKSIWVINSIE